MVELITKCGTPFFVDEDVAPGIAHLAWKLDAYGYVTRKTTVNGQGGKTVLLHRTVMGCTDPSVFVDHEDSNKLNNVRLNLRLASRMQNGQNRLKSSGLSSQFKGVTWHKGHKKWQASIKAEHGQVYIGLFHDEHEAAHEYNRAAIEHHGEFARLNPVGFDPHTEREASNAG